MEELTSIAGNKTISPDQSPLNAEFSNFRTSGVTDHYAVNDEHALSIARSIVANLNYEQHNLIQTNCEQPLFSMEDINAIIPSDPKKGFDIRKVRSRLAE